MGFQVYLQNELPPAFSGFDKGISWFDLHKIYSTCPAKWKYEEREASAVPIAEHAAILNPIEFARRFVREPAKEDYPDALFTDKDICAWLKEKGISGYSGKKFGELMQLVERTGEKPIIWSIKMENFYMASGIDGLQPVKPADYDRILQMREVIFANKQFAEKFIDSFNDVTIVGEIDGVLLNVRYDAMLKSGEFFDYVACTNASESEFANQAIRGGYYLKQALLHDVFVAAYGKEPARQAILAQERSFPNIPMDYTVSAKMIEIGRMQYKTAIALHKQCVEKDIWPTYALGQESTELPVPEYYARKYGLGEKK